MGSRPKTPDLGCLGLNPPALLLNSCNALGKVCQPLCLSANLMGLLGRLSEMIHEYVKHLNYCLLAITTL